MMKKHRRPTTRAERKAKRTATLPDTFVPRFLEQADKRQRSIRILRERLERLMQDAGGDGSFQREMLCRRAVFIATKLETMETNAATEGELDFGVYTQATNALSGLLSKLGLDRKPRQAADLKTYIASGDKKRRRA